MNDTTQSKKTSFPFKAVVLTIIGTLALAGAGIHFSGWRLLRGNTTDSAGSSPNLSADIAPGKTLHMRHASPDSQRRTRGLPYLRDETHTETGYGCRRRRYQRG